MKLAILVIFLLPKSTSFILDGSREPTPTKIVPPGAVRRGRMASVLAPLLFLPPSLPAWAHGSDIKQLINKVDAIGVDIKELLLDDMDVRNQIAAATQEVFYVPALIVGMGVFGTAMAAVLVSSFAKQDLSGLATTDDISTFSTKTKADFATIHAEVSSFATKTTEDVAGVRAEVAGVASQLKKMNKALAVTKKQRKKAM
jgi:hypothetical protein